MFEQNQYSYTYAPSGSEMARSKPKVVREVKQTMLSQKVHRPQVGPARKVRLYTTTKANRRMDDRGY